MSPLWAALALGTASVGTAPLDALAPLAPGFPATGGALDLVVRPDPAGCRLLLSDAQTDAPILGAHLKLKQFGAAGTSASESPAVAGRYEGHYLLPTCPGPGEAAVVSVTRDGRPGEELLAVTVPPAPAAPPVPAVPPGPSGPGVPGAALFSLLTLIAAARRRLSAVLPVALVLTLSTDAWAHGVAEAALPVAPGDREIIPQEIQFALGLRTALVEPRLFQVPKGDGTAADAVGLAPRTAPAVPRSAIVERDGKKLVFVRDGPERFTAREVTLGWTDGQNVAAASGCSPGDLVVMSGAAFLRNGGSPGP